MPLPPLIEDSSLLRMLSSNAAEDARRRFDLQKQVDAYLDWYEEIIDWHTHRPIPKGSPLPRRSA